MLNYRSPVHDSVGLHGRLSWLCGGIAALAVFSKEVKCYSIRLILKSGFKSRRAKSRITMSCELGRRSRLRHTHLRRQKFGYPSVLKPAKNRSLLINYCYVKEAEHSRC